MSIPFNVQRSSQTYAEDHAESAAFVARWRARGGYEGALARQYEPVRYGPFAVRGHMPFPGHRHCGEIG